MARLLTKRERIEARHWLQQLMEQARTARNALDPANGMLAITDEAWAAQWAALRKDLDSFTERVRIGKPSTSTGSITDRNA